MSDDNHPHVIPTPWLVAFGLFFTVIFLANGFMIYMANDTWSGLVTKEYYQSGLAYNQVLAAQSAQEVLGWQAKLHAVDQAGATHLTLSLSDRQQHPVAGTQVQGVLYRSVHGGTDQVFTMVEGVAPGIYTARVVAPLPGWWEVRLTATAPVGEFRYVERIRINRPSTEGRQP